MILEIFDAVKNCFVVAPFNPDDHRMRLPNDCQPTKQPTKTTKPPTRKVDDDVFYNKASQNYVRRTDEPTTKTVSWEVVKTVAQADTTKARIPDITDNDRQELANRNLETDKALVIKPYWVREVGRQDAAKMIDQKGFHQRLIGEYYAAFSASIKGKDD